MFIEINKLNQLKCNLQASSLTNKKDPSMKYKWHKNGFLDNFVINKRRYY